MFAELKSCKHQSAVFYNIENRTLTFESDFYLIFFC